MSVGNTDERASSLLTTAVPPGRVLVGTAAMALVLGLSRWGTNIGFSPLFITDILIALSLVNWLLTAKLTGRRPLSGWVPRSAPTVLFQLFFFYMLARFLFAVGNGPILLWLRDGMPFLYGIMAFISARSLATSAGPTRALTMKVFWWAMGVHLVWTSLVHVTGTQSGFSLPGGVFSAPVFQMRPDIDSALIALTVGMCLRQVMLGRHRTWAVLGILVGVATVFTLGTRAGLISVIIALAVSYGLTYSAIHKLSGRRVAMVLMVPAVVVLLAIVLPMTTPGKRLLATVGEVTSSSAASAADVGAQENAQGTQRAREMVWSATVDWTNETTARHLFGSGFGNDFLEQAGVKSFLEGTTYTNVRSPHNWFVGIYARMGLIGLSLAAVFIIQLMYLILRHRQRIGEDPLFSLSALTVVAILPVATLGVVLEAPFGAVPFFWASGMLMTLAPARQGRGADRITDTDTDTATDLGPAPATRADLPPDERTAHP